MDTSFLEMVAVLIKSHFVVYHELYRTYVLRRNSATNNKNKIKITSVDKQRTELATI